MKCHNNLLYCAALLSSRLEFPRILSSSLRRCWRRYASNESFLLLPLSINQALFPGQTSDTILLKEGRWFDLIDESIEDHQGWIGTVLMGQDGLLPILPICEIVQFELAAGYRGKVTATVQLKGVGRAKLVELQ